MMETETLKKNLASLSGFLKTEFIDDAILLISDIEKENEELKKEVEKGYFVNMYEDTEGYFISDETYDSYESAYDAKDQLSTYKKTVKIIEYDK